MEYNPEFVDLIDVPIEKRQIGSTNVWRQRFLDLPDGKAGMLHYNNRQRAHQVRNLISVVAKYHKFSICTRIIHAEPAIHETDGWLLYFWKRDETKEA